VVDRIASRKSKHRLLGRVHDAMQLAVKIPKLEDGIFLP